MSQNVDIGPSFIFIPKKREDFDHFFHDYFSSFHKTKTRNYIKTRRHCSLKMTVLIRHLKFYTCNTNIKGDILVKKKKS